MCDLPAHLAWVRWSSSAWSTQALQCLQTSSSSSSSDSFVIHGVLKLYVNVRHLL